MKVGDLVKIKHPLTEFRVWKEHPLAFVIGVYDCGIHIKSGTRKTVIEIVRTDGHPVTLLAEDVEIISENR